MCAKTIYIMWWSLSLYVHLLLLVMETFGRFISSPGRCQLPRIFFGKGGYICRHAYVTLWPLVADPPDKVVLYKEKLQSGSNTIINVCAQCYMQTFTKSSGISARRHMGSASKHIYYPGDVPHIQHCAAINTTSRVTHWHTLNLWI